MPALPHLEMERSAREEGGLMPLFRKKPQSVVPTEVPQPPVAGNSIGNLSAHVADQGLQSGMPMPCDVYGPDPIVVPEAYTLGEFKRLSKDEVDLHWLPTKDDKYSDQVRAEVLIGEKGLWRYRLIPKHDHQCCPDCGLDRKRLEELEARLKPIEEWLDGSTTKTLGYAVEFDAHAKWLRDHEVRLTAAEGKISEHGPRIELRYQDASERINHANGRIDAIESGSAPGIMTRLANLDEFAAGSVVARAEFKQELANLSDQYESLHDAMDNAGVYLAELAKLAGRQLGMSEAIPYQPARPCLIELKGKKEK
jgi:hypothetical protein